jgi:predicted secreted protein
MLNQNAKTYGGARCPGIYSPLVDEVRARGWRIEQMPCPELTFTGVNRFWAVREQYDTITHRRHCRRLAAAVCGVVEFYLAQGEDVLFVGLEGSPSMGVCITSSDPNRGGRPVWADEAPELAPGQGIFVEELRAELARSGVFEPRFIGVTHALPHFDAAAEVEAIRTALES